MFFASMCRAPLTPWPSQRFGSYVFRGGSSASCNPRRVGNDVVRYDFHRRRVRRRATVLPETSILPATRQGTDARHGMVRATDDVCVHHSHARASRTTRRGVQKNKALSPGRRWASRRWTAEWTATGPCAPP